MTTDLDYERLAEEFDMDVPSVLYWAKITRLMSAVRKMDHRTSKPLKSPRVAVPDKNLGDLVEQVLPACGKISTNMVTYEISLLTGAEFGVIRKKLLKSPDLKKYRTGPDYWKLPKNNSDIPEYPLDM